MRRLTRRLGPARLGEERGAVAVLVALLLVPLLGCGAIAVDVASLYADREKLQTAADAAAIAVALDCAGGACGNTTATATAALTANAGSAQGAALNTPTVAVSGNTVTVTVSADQAHWFAPVLGVDSTRVTASATATWQAASEGISEIPLAMSYCEYQKQIAAYPLTSTTARKLSWLTDGIGLCRAPQGGWFIDVGHARTDTDSSGVCRTTSSIGQSIDINLYDNRLPSTCTKAHLDELRNTDVQIPVWGDASLLGQRVEIYGYALFHLTSYTLTTGEPVLYGYFTRGVQTTSSAATTSAPYLGAGSVSLTSQG